MPKQEEILIRLSLFQRVFAGCRQSLPASGSQSLRLGDEMAAG